MARTLYCWRCKMEIPMLDEGEWREIAPLLSKSFDENQKRSALNLYERMTGFRETNINAIWHHRIADYGPPCTECGKPLRTPRANLCAACGAGKKRAEREAAEERSSRFLEMTAEQEFEAMVEEFRPLGFRHSGEVSRYIRDHKLGNKYRKLSGELELSTDTDAWVFSGAIDPKYYARLCSELDLEGKKTRAVPGRFTSEEDREASGVGTGKVSRPSFRDNDGWFEDDDFPF